MKIKEKNKAGGDELVKGILVMITGICITLTSLPCSMAGSDQSEMEAIHHAERYLKQMIVNCQDSAYVKQDSMIVEYKGKPQIYGLHEPSTSDMRLGIQWDGYFDVGADRERMFSNATWSSWEEGLPQPVAIRVVKKQGIWSAAGLERLSCEEIPVAHVSLTQATSHNMIPTTTPWLFPDSDSRYLTESDLRDLSIDDLWVARNEIYARRGFIFKTNKGKAYARSLGNAYRPITDKPLFNIFEQKNISTIQSFEQRGR
jgi:hypothetical protein